MISALIICTVCLLCTAGSVGCKGVQQTPGLLVQRGQSAQMDCSHTLPGAFYNMYWFQQLPGQSMELIVHTVPYKKPDFGNFSQDKYSASKTVIESGSFTVKNHTHCDYYYDARFGPGTKLTVLDSNRTITPPKVKVLQPSPNECQTNKDRKHKKTLVCVASHFYPDHVSVFWQIDGVNVTRGVATDDAALWGGEHYSISSRLTVPHSDWFTPSKTFTCTVSFFNGNYTVPRSDWVQGVKGVIHYNEAIFFAGKYLSITHTAKLFYAILIAKSSVFGVFVVFLVWRLQVCPCTKEIPVEVLYLPQEMALGI
uniref:Ig-like domain-containing protein n=1 Tax=Sander lucioperca TaxID=283035 RepID=A0A8D0DCQ5_SANLU